MEVRRDGMEARLFGFAVVDVGEEVDEAGLTPARAMELGLDGLEGWDKGEGLVVIH
jgi:hypothetical protein